MKKILCLFVMVCCLLAGCSEDAATNLTRENSRIILEKAKNEEGSKNEATIKYYVSMKSSLYGKDHYYTVKYESLRYGAVLNDYPLKKVKDGYQLLAGEDKNFVIPEKGALGYSEVFLLDKPSGTFTLHLTKDQRDWLFENNSGEKNKDTEYWERSAKIFQKQKN